PTRGGCGEISWVNLSSVHVWCRFVQPPTNTKQAQSAINKLSFRNTGSDGNSRQRFVPQRAGTRSDFFSRLRKHVVIHADDHRDEHDRVVEEMYFDAKFRKQ